MVLRNADAQAFYCIAAQNGFKECEQFLLNSQKIMILSIVKRYDGRVKEDRLQIAMMSFVKAIRTFDVYRRLKLSTYAWTVVRNELYKTRGQSLIITSPTGAQIDAANLFKADIWNKYQAMDLFGWTERRAITAMRVAKIISASQLSGVERHYASSNCVGTRDTSPNPFEIACANDKKGLVEDALEEIPERTRDILHRRYGFNGYQAQTLQEIGTEIGISRERVRQLSNIAFEQLREIIKESDL